MAETSQAQAQITEKPEDKDPFRKKQQKAKSESEGKEPRK